MNTGGDFLGTLTEEDEYEEDNEEEIKQNNNKNNVVDSKYGDGRNHSASVISFKNEVNFPVLDDVNMRNMIQLSTINDGQSRFGKCHRYQNRSSMHEYAVTQWDVSSLEDQVSKMALSEVIEELVKLSALKHSKIARFYGYHLANDTLSMFRTYVPNGTLADKLKRGPIEERTTSRYFKQILEGLAYLHDTGAVHGNLKATNVLITLSNDIQLTDMYIQYSPAPEAHMRRSLYFSAPEILVHRGDMIKFTAATDIWAAGCVLVMMITRIVPYKEQLYTRNGGELYEKMLRAHERGQFTYKSEELIPNASNEIATIADLAFTKDPKNRPTASKLLQLLFGDITSFPGRKSATPSVSTRKSEDSKDKYDPNFLYNDAPQIIVTEPDHESGHLLSKRSDSYKEEENMGCFGCFRWYTSKLLIFGTLLFKWIAMVLIAGVSLAMVAGSVFFAIFVIYNGIGVICQCQLNEGFIVLIALILLPIIILLTTLCCNNSCEKYKQAVEEGKLERSRYVTPHPEEDIVLCGIIVVDGKKENKHSLRRKTGSPEDDPTAATNLPVTSFTRGVARLA